MATVALMVHSRRADARRLAEQAAEWLGANGHRARLLALRDTDQITEGERSTELSAVDLAGTTLAVSLGGDGTFLRLVARAWAADVPVLGVNFGRLGYLLEVTPAAFLDVLRDTLAGRATFEERTALSVEVALPEGTAGHAAASPDGSVAGVPHFALNEVVLEKTVFGHTVRLAAAIDGEEFLTYSADGLLVSTPTGSTAYNLSAGGPVLSPRLAAMVVTPVAPHLSLDRSLVLHPAQVVTVEVRQGRPAALVLDGQEAGRLPPGSEVTCRVAPRPVRVVSTGERGLGGLLRVTLALDGDR